MKFLHRYSIRHPIRVLGMAMLLVMAVAPGVLRLRLRTDGFALVPASRPEVLYDRSIRDAFDVEDLIVVLIRSRHHDGIFNTGALRLIKELTAEFQAIDGIRPQDVSSLATEHSHRVIPGTLKARRFLDPLPETPVEIARLRDDLERIQLHTGTVVSRDGKAASILVGTPVGVDRTALYNQVRRIIADHEPRPQRIDVIGAPVAEALLGAHILEDLGVPPALLGTYQESADIWQFPTSLYALRQFIGRHVGLVPIAIGIMALVFLVSFKSPFAACLPLIEAGACLATVFGLMGWLGVPIYLTIAVMPVILTAIGVADEIHVFTRYVHELRNRPEATHRDALSVTMDEMFAPVVKTSVTTAVGFLSFAVSPLEPVRAFGIFTAIGIIFCMFWSLTAIPAMLALVNPRSRVVGIVRPRRSHAEPDAMPLGARVFGWLAAVVLRRRLAVIALGIAVVMAAPFGVSRVIVQDSWIDGFAPDSAFYRATEAFNEQFLGTHVLLVPVKTEHQVFSGELPMSAIGDHEVSLPADLVEDPDVLLGYRISLTGRELPAGKAGKRNIPARRRMWGARIDGVDRRGDRIVLTTDRRRGLARVALRNQPGDTVPFEIKIEPMTKPDVIQRIEKLESFINSQKEHTVGGVIGTASLIKTANLMGSGMREGTRIVPDNTDRIRWVWSQVRRIRGPERMGQHVDADFAQSLVTVFLKNANFVDVRALMNAIREYEQEHLKPHGISLGFAGDVAVSQTVIDAVVTTQRSSLIGSLVGILLLTAILGGGLRWGFLSVLPCALAVLVNFAVMGWIRMPLGVATSMFAGMTLGIGVDYAIHLLERYRLGRRRGLDVDAAIRDTVTITGPAVFIDAGAVALGFGIMTLSQVPANARLGALLVLSTFGCLAAALLLLPALLSVFSLEARRAGR